MRMKTKLLAEKEWQEIRQVTSEDSAVVVGKRNGVSDDYLIASRCNAWAHGKRYSRERPSLQPEVGGVAGG